MATVEASQKSKVCTICWKMKQISQFRRRYKDAEIRHNHCRTCINQQHRDARKRRRNKVMYALAQEINDKARKNGKFFTIVCAVSDRFKGAEGFGKVWYEAYESARDAGKHHLVLRQFVAFLHMLQAAQPSLPKVENMSDEELRQHHLKLLVDDVWNRPEIAILVLEKKGYTIVPPAEVDSEEDGEG